MTLYESDRCRNYKRKDDLCIFVSSFCNVLCLVNKTGNIEILSSICEYLSSPINLSSCRLGRCPLRHLLEVLDSSKIGRRSVRRELNMKGICLNHK